MRPGWCQPETAVGLRPPFVSGWGWRPALTGSLGSCPPGFACCGAGCGAAPWSLFFVHAHPCSVSIGCMLSASFFFTDTFARVRDPLGVEQAADDRRVHGQPGVEELVRHLFRCAARHWRAESASCS